MNDLRHQVIWNRLISIVEEQALTLVRTTFSTSVREAGDLSAGVFDVQGRMIAQAITGTPGHVNTMAAAVGNFIEDIGPHRIYEGDAYITNDPWKGTGHLHDFTVVTPVFRKGILIGYFACTAHVVDVGGRGFGPDAGEVYEEGLFVPIMKFIERGVLNRDLINIVHHNVRESGQVVGDLHSLAACNETGMRRLLSTLDEFDLDDLEEVATFVFDRTRRATLERLRALPCGTYTNEMRVDGYNDTITLAVTLTVTGSGAHADFTGTSPTCGHGVNVPLGYAHAYMTYALLVALAPEMPSNHASLAPFTVSAPEGCILNARHPDPVSVRHVIGHSGSLAFVMVGFNSLPGIMQQQRKVQRGGPVNLLKHLVITPVLIPFFLPQSIESLEAHEGVFIHGILVIKLVLYKASQASEFGQVLTQKIQLMHAPQNMPHCAGLIQNFQESFMHMQIYPKLPVYQPHLITNALRKIGMQPNAMALHE